MSNKECIIKICNISNIPAFVFCDMYTIHVLIYVLLCICWRFFKVEKIKCMTIFGKCFLLIKPFETKPREILLCKASCLKNHETYFLSCIYINILHMTMSLICLMEQFYIFFFQFSESNFRHSKHIKILAGNIVVFDISL